MRPLPPAGMGWPFLVAAGWRREYSTVLAPDFLVAELDYGILEEVARPGEEHATVLRVMSRRGRRLIVVQATHLVTAADIATVGTASDAPAPRDEHSRPLRIIYGFVALDGWITEPAEADLLAARATALDAYRRFLADEERFVVLPSGAISLSSVVAPPPPREAGGPREAGQPPAPIGRTVRIGAVAFLCVVALFVILAVLLRPRPPGPAACPPSPAAAWPEAAMSCPPSSVR